MCRSLPEGRAPSGHAPACPVNLCQAGGRRADVSGPEVPQLARAETLGDTGRVLSRYVHAIVRRTGDQGVLDEPRRRRPCRW